MKQFRKTSSPRSPWICFSEPMRQWIMHHLKAAVLSNCIHFFIVGFILRFLFPVRLPQKYRLLSVGHGLSGVSFFHFSLKNADKRIKKDKTLIIQMLVYLQVYRACNKVCQSSKFPYIHFDRTFQPLILEDMPKAIISKFYELYFRFCNCLKSFNLPDSKSASLFIQFSFAGQVNHPVEQ